ncbi:hypothetical protein LUZ63_004962 [Rhynchospora breviuscula]|uniref:BED-type domain-containing protein n=1 Tax=Rhynchospora breviuscula TaxID=2022672 RepID=A0A9Q0HSL9_9POAL|nr:hypothetical protein LUZ63_004962 [Rhynchospora breviuscula]
MGAGLRGETREEIESIQAEARASNEPTAAAAAVGDAPATDAPSRKRQKKKTSPWWEHFTEGETAEDGSYTATCINCGYVIIQGNQKGTSGLKGHIKKSCKKIPRDKRFKPDAMQYMLQAASEKGVLTDQIANVREAMKYIRNSQSRMEKFNLAISQAKAPKKKPAWDVPTRWNSTFLMLELALELKDAILRYDALDSNFEYCPTDDDWHNVHILVEHLRILYEATNKLSGTKYPTLNLFFPEFCEVYLNIQKMCKDANLFVVQMGKKMLTKWEKYWSSGNVLLAIGCILDPRCKMAVVEYYFRELYPFGDAATFIDSLKQVLNALFKEYSESNPTSQSQSATSSTHLRSAASSSMSNTKAGLKDYLSVMKTSEPIKSELEEYLTEPLDLASVDDDFDILAWWKLKVHKYPIMAKMTRDILAAPISTIASESTFSNAGRTLSPVRSSLSDESLQALICAQDWLRASVTEQGGAFGDVIWSSDEAIGDDTICATAASCQYSFGYDEAWSAGTCTSIFSLAPWTSTSELQ